jgi:hypothetical protein
MAARARRRAAARARAAGEGQTEGEAEGGGEAEGEMQSGVLAEGAHDSAELLGGDGVIAVFVYLCRTGRRLLELSSLVSCSSARCSSPLQSRGVKSAVRQEPTTCKR